LPVEDLSPLLNQTRLIARNGRPLETATEAFVRPARAECHYMLIE
jgi:hypothetical protein